MLRAPARLCPCLSLMQAWAWAQMCTKRKAAFWKGIQRNVATVAPSGLPTLRMPADLHTYSIGGPQGPPRTLLSYLSPQDLNGTPLPQEAIVGELLGDPETLDPTRFRPGVVFHAFLQWVVARHAPLTFEWQQMAQAVGDGPLEVVDLRVGKDRPVTAPDLLGVFEVRHGTMQSYRINPEHVLLTDRGLTELDPALLSALLRELRAVATAPAG